MIGRSTALGLGVGVLPVVAGVVLGGEEKGRRQAIETAGTGALVVATAAAALLSKVARNPSQVFVRQELAAVASVGTWSVAAAGVTSLGRWSATTIFVGNTDPERQAASLETARKELADAEAELAGLRERREAARKAAGAGDRYVAAADEAARSMAGYLDGAASDPTVAPGRLNLSGLSIRDAAALFITHYGDVTGPVNPANAVSERDGVRWSAARLAIAADEAGDGDGDADRAEIEGLLLARVDDPKVGVRGVVDPAENQAFATSDLGEQPVLGNQ